MSSALRTIAAAFVVVAIALSGIAAQAQPAEPSLVYYIAPDADGVRQVYQHLLDGESEPRQLTTMDSDVLSVGVAPDGLAVAFISGGALWSQSVHTDEAIEHAPVDGEFTTASPVYSPDGGLIAFQNDGVWVHNRVTGETTQLLVDVPVNETTLSVDDQRIYAPERFVETADGLLLVLDVGIWEWRTDGVYDMQTGEVGVIGDLLHTDLLLLSDGRALLYGNHARAGEPALHIADDPRDINTYTKVLDFADLSDAFLHVAHAREIEPNVVRIFGTGLDVEQPDRAIAFYLDVDLTTNTPGELHDLILPDDIEQPDLGQPSPDGRLLPVFDEILVWAGYDITYAGLVIEDIETGERVASIYPESVSGLRWQE